MQFSRKALISIDVSQKNITELFKTVGKMDFLKHAEVHLTYVFQTNSMSLGLGDLPYVYPSLAEQRSVQQSIEATLMDLGSKAFGDDFQVKIIARCLFGEDAKYRLCEYIDENNIDLVLMWARAKRGLFESSFSNYVSKHTSANVVILKQKE